MGLHVGSDVLAPAECLTAFGEEACPAVVFGVLLADVLLDFFGGDAGVFDCGVERYVCD